MYVGKMAVRSLFLLFCGKWDYVGKCYFINTK